MYGMHTRRRMVETSKYIRKNSFFTCILSYFHMQSSLTYFVMFGEDFRYCFAKDMP